MRPAARALGRPAAGIPDAVRFVCHACDRKLWRMRVAFVVVVAALGVAAVVMQLAWGRETGQGSYGIGSVVRPCADRKRKI